MILYIHGFRTTPNSVTSKKLKKRYKKDVFLADHPTNPKLALKYLEKIIKKKDITSIVASSLGGYYATYLSNKYDLKTVLINPSVQPYKTTKRFIGINYTQENKKFDWDKKHIKYLRKLKVAKLDTNKFYIFLQKGDIVLDYKVAKKRFENAKFLIEKGGNHTFKNLEKHYEKIEKFLEYKN